MFIYIYILEVIELISQGSTMGKGWTNYNKETPTLAVAPIVNNKLLILILGACIRE